MGMKKGFGLELLDTVQNEGLVHHKLIASVEQITKRNLVCYTSNFPHPAGAIMEQDDAMIETVLKSLSLEKYENKLDLMIHTRGGDPVAAHKIVETCRSYSSGFRVIVAKTAMSAGTLIAMGADCIVMRNTSELGPIDPQMLVRTPAGQIMRPASAYVNAYLDLINKAQQAIVDNKPAHPYLQQLAKMDPSWIQTCVRARDFARAIAQEYLKRYMLSSKAEPEIKEIVEKFIKTGEQRSHGFGIRPEKAKELGLTAIEIIDKQSNLEKLIWQLLVRTEIYVQTKRLAKYICSRTGGINVQVEAVRFLP